MRAPFRRRHAAYVVAALVAAPFATVRGLRAQSVRDPRFGALVSLAEAKMKELGVPGVALGIIDGASLTTCGLGVTKDRPNAGGPSREYPVTFYGPDRVVVTAGPDLGQSIEFVRDDAGRVDWIRVVGRVAVRASAGATPSPPSP